MSGYNSQREVRAVIVATLRTEGEDPARFSVAGIARDAFYFRGPGYGYGARSATEWEDAKRRHRRKR